MSRSPRAEALRYVRSETPTTPPRPDEYQRFLHEPDAERYVIETLKPRRYAALAELMGDMFMRMEDASTPSSWTDLHLQTLRRIRIAHKRTKREKLPTYTNAAEFTRIATRLPIINIVKFDKQLKGGAETASHTMTRLLFNIPSIVHAHDPSIPRENFGDIARNGFGLPWRMAMTSVNQLRAAQEGLSMEMRPFGLHQHFSAPLNTDEFALTPHADNSHSLRFRDFMGITVAAGRTVLGSGFPVLEDMAVRDFPAFNGPTIGCPITLLNEQLQQMWNEQIDLVEQGGLWERTR